MNILLKTCQKVTKKKKLSFYSDFRIKWVMMLILNRFYVCTDISIKRSFKMCEKNLNSFPLKYANIRQGYRLSFNYLFFLQCFNENITIHSKKACINIHSCSRINDSIN